jgi:hypothetical protein
LLDSSQRSAVSGQLSAKTTDDHGWSDSAQPVTGQEDGSDQPKNDSECYTRAPSELSCHVHGMTTQKSTGLSAGAVVYVLSLL